jgi:hypothetical protein
MKDNCQHTEQTIDGLCKECGVDLVEMWNNLIKNHTQKIERKEEKK